MNFEEKFRIEKPNEETLARLGKLVDEIENLKHQEKDYRAKLEQLNNSVTIPTSIEDICSYYSVCTREEFLQSLPIPDPYQHKGLSEDEILWLMGQIVANISDDPLVSYYSTIIESNLSVRAGILTDLIVQEDINISANDRGFLSIQVKELIEVQQLLESVLRKVEGNLSRTEVTPLHVLQSGHRNLCERIERYIILQNRHIHERSSKTRLSVRYYGLMGDMRRISEQSLGLSNTHWSIPNRS